MKKILLLITVLLISSGILAVTIEYKGEIIEWDYAAFQKSEMSKLDTEKEKDGEKIVTNWLGVEVITILEQIEVIEYERIAFVAPDNYLVHISREEVELYQPLLAYYENGARLEEGNRLVIDKMPAMYWIREVATIKVESAERPGKPEMIWDGTALLKEIEITDNPDPFVNCQGYFARQLIKGIFPQPEGEFLLVGKDGISHSLDYQTYLAKAVLVKTESGYMLQSPQMPGGMWIKDLAIIQKEDAAVLMREFFTNWDEVFELMNWEKTDGKILVETSKANRQAVSLQKEFSAAEYENALRYRLP